MNKMMGTTGACEESVFLFSVVHPVAKALIQFTAAPKTLCNI